MSLLYILFRQFFKKKINLSLLVFCILITVKHWLTPNEQFLVYEELFIQRPKFNCADNIILWYFDEFFSQQWIEYTSENVSMHPSRRRLGEISDRTFDSLENYIDKTTLLSYIGQNPIYHQTILQKVRRKSMSNWKPLGF